MTLLTAATVAAAGLALLFYSRSLDVFMVPYLDAMEAKRAWCPWDGPANPAARDAFIELFSKRYWLADIGFSMTSTGAATAGTALALRYIAPDRHWFATPMSRTPYILLVVAAAMLFAIGIAWSGAQDFARGFSCSDAGIRVVPFVIAAFAVVAVVAGVVMFVLTLLFGKLPVPLLRWDRERPVLSWAVTILALPAAIGIAILIVMLAPIPFGGIAITGMVLAIYLLAATRAALLAPRGPAVPQSDPDSPPAA